MTSPPRIHLPPPPGARPPGGAALPGAGVRSGQSEVGAVVDLSAVPALRPARCTTAPAAGAGAGARGRGGERRVGGRLLLLALLAAVPVVVVLGTALGAVRLPPVEVVRALLGKVVPAWGRGVDPLTARLVWDLRLPRVLLALVVGAGLAVAGAVLQVVVRNPLAEPYVLGLSAGASLSAVAVLTTAGAAGVLATVGVGGAAFVGALGTLALVLALGSAGGRVVPERMLLAGVALSSLFTAATSWLQLRSNPTELSAVLFWLLGTVAGASWADLGLPVVVVVIAGLLLLREAASLDALLLGEETAASLGVRVAVLRARVLVLAAALTAAVIAVAGGVGFVGLVAPHAVRLLVGAGHRVLLPASALLGGIFLVGADLVGRVVATPLELPLGVVTAIVGVPFFLVLLVRSSAVGR